MRLSRSFEERELSDRERKNFAILDTIRKRGPIARTDITKLTGFNIVTVSNYIEHYIKNGLVTEEGYDTSTGGRKPMLVSLNQKYGYALGVGFDITGVTGLIIDLKGKIVFKVTKKHRVIPGMALIEELMAVAEELLEQGPVERDKIKGIGLGVAGVIDRENRTIRWPIATIAFDAKDVVISVSLWDKFVKRFNIPVIVENDADCAAYGEQWLVLDPEYKNVIYMYSGVACGIMINGQIFKGTSGCAGELGIFNPNILDKYDWEKESFGLGRWDMEVGMLRDIEELQKKHGESLIFKLANNNIEEISFINILEAANENDELAIMLLHKAGEDVGKKVAFLVNLLNPQVVIIGGGLERAGSVFIEPLKKTVKEWTFEEANRVLKILPAKLAEDAVPIGGASLVIKNFFEQV